MKTPQIFVQGSFSMKLKLCHKNRDNFLASGPFNNQFGFRVYNSTGHTLFQLINDIINSFENNVFIDLSKASDTVYHDILLTNLDPPTREVGRGAGGHIPPVLFLRSYFAGDVFLEIRFCFILQDIQNFFIPVLQESRWGP